MDVILQNHTSYDEAVIEYYYQNLKYENKNGKRELADFSRHFIIIEVFIGIVVCTLIGSNKWIYSIPLIAITFIFLYYWTISYTKKIFLKLDSNYSYKRYKEKVTYNFYDDKLEIIRKYDRTIIEWKNITCCNIKKNLCWLGYGNKGLVINGDEFRIASSAFATALPSPIPGPIPAINAAPAPIAHPANAIPFASN